MTTTDKVSLTLSPRKFSDRKMGMLDKLDKGTATYIKDIDRAIRAIIRDEVIGDQEARARFCKITDFASSQVDRIIFGDPTQKNMFNELGLFMLMRISGGLGLTISEFITKAEERAVTDSRQVVEDAWGSLDEAALERFAIDDPAGFIKATIAMINVKRESPSDAKLTEFVREITKDKPTLPHTVIPGNTWGIGADGKGRPLRTRIVG